MYIKRKVISYIKNLSKRDIFTYFKGTKTYFILPEEINDIWILTSLKPYYKFFKWKLKELLKDVEYNHQNDYSLFLKWWVFDFNFKYFFEKLSFESNEEFEKFIETLWKIFKKDIDPNIILEKNYKELFYLYVEHLYEITKKNFYFKDIYNLNRNFLDFILENIIRYIIYNKTWIKPYLEDSFISQVDKNYLTYRVAKNVYDSLQKEKKQLLTTENIRNIKEFNDIRNLIENFYYRIQIFLKNKILNAYYNEYIKEPKLFFELIEIIKSYSSYDMNKFINFDDLTENYIRTRDKSTLEFFEKQLEDLKDLKNEFDYKLDILHFKIWKIIYWAWREFFIDGEGKKLEKELHNIIKKEEILEILEKKLNNILDPRVYDEEYIKQYEDESYLDNFIEYWLLYSLTFEKWKYINYNILLNSMNIYHYLFNLLSTYVSLVIINKLDKIKLINEDAKILSFDEYKSVFYSKISNTIKLDLFNKIKKFSYKVFEIYWNKLKNINLKKLNEYPNIFEYIIKYFYKFKTEDEYKIIIDNYLFYMRQNYLYYSIISSFSNLYKNFDYRKKIKELVNFIFNRDYDAYVDLSVWYWFNENYETFKWYFDKKIPQYIDKLDYDTIIETESKKLALKYYWKIIRWKTAKLLKLNYYLKKFINSNKNFINKYKLNKYSNLLHTFIENNYNEYKENNLYYYKFFWFSDILLSDRYKQLKNTIFYNNQIYWKAHKYFLYDFLKIEEAKRIDKYYHYLEDYLIINNLYNVAFKNQWKALLYNTHDNFENLIKVIKSLHNYFNIYKQELVKRIKNNVLKLLEFDFEFSFDKKDVEKIFETWDYEMIINNINSFFNKYKLNPEEYTLKKQDKMFKYAYCNWEEQILILMYLTLLKKILSFEKNFYSMHKEYIETKKSILDNIKKKYNEIHNFIEWKILNKQNFFDYKFSDFLNEIKNNQKLN